MAESVPPITSPAFRRPALRQIAPALWGEVIANDRRRAARRNLGALTGAHGERTRSGPLDTPTPAYALAWHQRIVQSTLPGQFRITVPLEGDPVPANANATLTRVLDRLWVSADARPERGPVMTSVVAIVGRAPGTHDGRHQVLSLLITADHVGDRDRIDGAGMGRQVRRALEQLALDAGAVALDAADR